MKVETIRIKTEKPFGAAVCSGAKDFVAVAAAEAKKVLIVSDDSVCKLYGNSIKKVIGGEPDIFTFVYPAAENGKSKYILDKLLILMTEIDLTESDCVIALGGSTVTALTAFACALFKGGIPYVSLPTTLTSMAGLCIKGDAGIDFLGRSDLFSTVYYPKAVFCDVEFLKTLSDDALNHGLAELLRCAVCGGKEIFTAIEKDEFDLEKSICAALKMKARVEEKANFSEQIKRKLCLGDTFARAAEIASHYLISKGDALAFGVMLAAEVSERLGIAENVSDRLTAAYIKLGLKTKYIVKKDEVMRLIVSDKRYAEKGIKLVLPQSIGKCVIKTFSIEDIKGAFFKR